MTRTTAAEIVTAALTEQPGQTAKELGMTGVTMNRLAKAGVVEVATERRSGDRGRPSNVYILVGQVFDTSEDDQAHIEAAMERLEAHRSYEKLSRAILDASEQFGYGSPEHVEAKLARQDAFPIIPELPSKNDYEITGEAKAVTKLSDLNAKTDADTADLDEPVAV